MAEDFKFTKQVSDVRQTVPIPIEKKTVKVEQHATPDFQSTINALAESQNNLSAIGAQVAQSASNSLASKLGMEQGKTPKGDLMPSLTEFDKNFAESYKAQAHATLTIQGQKLLTDTQLELSKQTRLSPDLLSKATMQVQQGLDRIASTAPTDVGVQLKQSFDSSLINNTKQFEHQMFTQQREDQKNNLIKASSVQLQNVYQLAVNGDMKGAQAASNAAKALINNQESNKFLSPEDARVQRETADQTLINASYINAATQADKAGKLEEFQKKLSEGPPDGLTNEQWVIAGSAVNKQMNFIQTLRSQDENLKAQQMHNQIALNPMSVSDADWNAFEKSVSKITAEKVRFNLIQARKQHSTETTSQDTLIANWGNPEVHANSSEKVVNASFNKQVDYAVQSSQKSNKPLSHEDAQVMVAASAGAQIPVFTRDLKNKLASANPALIESASQQINALRTIQAGRALAGLSAKDNAMVTQYASLRNSSTDLNQTAREVTNAIYNQDPAVEEMNNKKWSSYLTKQTSGGKSLSDVALEAVDFKAKNFLNPSMAEVYSADILSKYHTNFTNTNGDNDSALKITKQYVDENYGDTGVNGGSHKTLHPLEQVLGFKDKDAIPYIQQDVINQLNEKLLPTKELFNSRKSNEYWETLPLSRKEHGVFSTSFDPIQIKRHLRTANGIKEEKFNLVLHGNSFDKWDVAVLTNSGMKNFMLVAPYVGFPTYTPNSKAIHDSYNAEHTFGTYDKTLHGVLNKKIDVNKDIFSSEKQIKNRKNLRNILSKDINVSELIK
jgi:hypothetical protein